MPSGPVANRTFPPLAPPTTSLLTAAYVVEETDNRWENGFEVEGEGCGSAAPWDDCGSADKVASDARNNSSFIPFVVYATDSCSTWGFSKSDERDRRTVRLLNNLAASESFVIEQELWSDTLGLGNPKIADTSTVTHATAVTILNAVAQVEDDAGVLAKGAGIMIHMRPYLFTLLVAQRILEKVGNKWYTPMGSIIVPGRGYAGTGPAGQAASSTEEWIYATSLVQVRLGKLLTIDNPADVVNHQTNDVLLLSERKAIASFDDSCIRVAQKVSR